MSRKFTITLFLSAALISTVGCSGSRLRNLVSRSDYQSLEDLESEDALAADGNDSTDASFVSESDAQDDVDSEKVERRGLLNLSSLFRRNKDNDEIDPDPFVETPVDEASEGEIKTADNRVTPITTQSAKDYVTNAAKSESLAEELFQPEKERSPSENIANNDQELPEIAPARGNSKPVEKSFADFIAEQSRKTAEKAEELVAETAEPVIERKKTFDEIVSNATSEVSEFDQMFGAADEANETSTVDTSSESPSQLFPGLDELISAAPKTTESTSTTKKPTFDEFFNAEEPVATERVVETQASPSFDTIVQNHGFSSVDKKDPWAAFQQSGNRTNASVGQPNAQPSSLSDGFDWGTPKTTETRPTAVAATSNVFDESTLVFSEDTTEPYTNTPAQYQVEPPRPEFTTTKDAVPSFNDMPLEIPAADENVAMAVEDDIFADSFETAETLSADEEAFQQAGAEGPVETTAGAPGLSAMSGFSTRTWFLLFGIVIVAILLFMPERQNQTKQ